MDYKELSEAGMTDNEIKAYTCLVENGPLQAGQISRKTGIHRRNVYDTTEMLIKKGLVGYILKNKKRLYQASNPNKIMESIEEKQKMLMPLVTSLQTMYSSTKEKEETNFYKGKEGLKSVFEDQLNYDEILILGASHKAYDILQFYFKWYDEKRKKNKINVKIISSERELKKVALGQIKYLPKEYASPVALNIYGDKTAIILWAENPIAIVIKNKEITEGYKKYFDLMWKIAKD